jgi:YaiO family outer membrane protein
MSKLTLLLICFLSLSSLLKAQTTDELFKDARQAAYETKDFDMAKQLALQALQKSPKYSEIEVFLGRVYTWNKQYDSARFHFSKVLENEPGNEDAGVAYADLEYWNDHYEAAIKICDQGLAVNPSSEPLLLRKAKSLNAEKKVKEAGAITDRLLETNHYNKAAANLGSAIKDAAAVNKITFNYDHTSFDKEFDKPWQLASLSYGRSTGLGSVIARVNVANRFGENGVQGEVDAYPRINKLFYCYVNLGYSGNVGVFPNVRGGFSLYANLPKSFEAEAGVRYLYFTSTTIVYTFAIGKYYKNFLFTARTYQTPSDFGLSQSYSLAGRYFLKGADDYIGLSIGSGISPDDNSQAVLFNTKQYVFTSRQLSASFYHTFLKWNILSMGVGEINQEYQKGVRGNQVDVWAGLSHRF